MSTLFQGASGLMINGGTFNATTNTGTLSKRGTGIDILMDWIATDAFYNSKELYNAPKCHPHTRVAVLNDIMKWVIEWKVQDEFMLWLFGPAGAGKSAIAKKIAELAAEKDLLIGSFFFSRTSPTRRTQDRLVATLVYQMMLSVPDARTHIEHAIETDPAIFHKDIQTQIDTLLIKPFQSAPARTISFPKLIIIDGLDECSDSQVQIGILDAISHSFTKHKLPIICLVASRPEANLVSSFNGNEPLKFIHHPLALDHNYNPEQDIQRFLSDKFTAIRCAHRLRSTIPIRWPTEESLSTLVRKSSGQFIFAATVVRFIESNRHQPAERLNIILGISPPGTTNPFAELDALYKQVLSSVEDIQLTLHVLSLYVSSPGLAYSLGKNSERFLSLKEGDIDRALIDLPSIISYNVSSGEINILHASLVDFLSDKRRSEEFYIDMTRARTDFTSRTLDFVKGPDGIRAGDRDILAAGIKEGGRILTGQLRDELVNFDLDAFITAATKSPYVFQINSIGSAFKFCMDLVPNMGLEDGDEQLLMHRCGNAFELRIQKYHSDWRLQLLLTLAVVRDSSSESYQFSQRRRLDILLEMDDDNLHLVDQDALDLRYSNGYFLDHAPILRDIISRYVDGDRFSSAALHCMHFLSNSPKYSAEIGITYGEWKATCFMALDLLHDLLKRIIPTPEVIQFLTEHQINPMVRELFPGNYAVETHILEFLKRATTEERQPGRGKLS